MAAQWSPQLADYKVNWFYPISLELVLSWERLRLSYQCNASLPNRKNLRKQVSLSRGQNVTLVKHKWGLETWTIGFYLNNWIVLFKSYAEPFCSMAGNVLDFSPAPKSNCSKVFQLFQIFVTIPDWCRIDLVGKQTLNQSKLKPIILEKRFNISGTFAA